MTFHPLKPQPERTNLMSKLKTLAIFAAMALAVLGGVASEAFEAA